MSLDLSRVAENSTLISVLMTCSSAWMESALSDPNGGQRWVIYDEAWRLMAYPSLLRRMDAQWRLARRFGIANMLIFHPLGIILPSLVSLFGLFLMRVYAVDAVPDSLIEAARIDGLSEVRIFWSVALRMLVPGTVTVLLFALVTTWNNYFLSMIMLSSRELYPITVGLAQWQAAGTAGGGAQVLYSTVITGALVSVVPLIIAFIYLQRYWQNGLSSGAVKE